MTHSRIDRDDSHGCDRDDSHGCGTRMQGFSRRQRTNGILLALLYLLPKLQKLKITAGSEIQLVAYSCSGAFAGGIPAGLRSVLHVALINEELEGGFRAFEVLPFMALPSIKTLTVIHSWARYDDVLWLPTGERFDATPSAQTSSPGGAVVSKSKEYGLPTQSSPIVDLSFEGSAIACSVMSLLSQACSLKELVIGCDYSFETPGDQPFIGLLSGLVALEILEVPACLRLEGFDDRHGSGSKHEPNANDSHQESGTGGVVVSHNPMDTMLPPSLVYLQCKLERVALDSFIKRTGLPTSLRFTRKRLSSLVNFIVGRHLAAPEDVGLRELLESVPTLRPPMNVIFFGTSTTASKRLQALNGIVSILIWNAFSTGLSQLG
ncbi:hypothetical protein DL93DRAFT_2101225 [Clavulina sp. PMI_390]|nr:hypothetical protein DL93DRAFT_2101225 [Clavulina sp. PMI_390]